MEQIAAMPDASPSSPSIIFSAFVMPTIHIAENTIPIHPRLTRSPERGFVINVNFVPVIMIMNAAANCIANFLATLRLYLSSSDIPKNMIVTPIKSPMNCGVNLWMRKDRSTKLLYITMPPVRGTGMV